MEELTAKDEEIKANEIILDIKEEKDILLEHVRCWDFKANYGQENDVDMKLEKQEIFDEKIYDSKCDDCNSTFTKNGCAQSFLVGHSLRKNISQNYEKMMQILNDTSDIEISDEDEEYQPPNWQPSLRSELADNCDGYDSDTDSQDSDNLTLSNQAAIHTTSMETAFPKRPLTSWRKKEFPYQDLKFRNPQRNAPNFQINNLPTPYEIFKQYIPDEIMKLFAERTNQYAVLKNGISVETNANEFEVLLGIHAKMGTLGFPRIRMYWSVKSGTRISCIADAMPVNRFFKLRNALHLVDTMTEIDCTDRLWKVRPLLNCVKSRCNKVQLTENYSINEMMVPFSGTLNIKQYIKGKPNAWGIKIFVISSSDGIVKDFIVYQGSTTKFDDQFKKFGLGGSVVLQLCKILPDGCRFKIAFDNYFTSLALLREMKNRELFGVGTIRNNRLEHCPLKNEKELKRLDRGCVDYRVDKQHNIAVVRWYDNKAVTVASSYLQVGPQTEVERWDKVGKRYIQIPTPEIIKKYNQTMGGVDLIDQCLAYYRISIRSRKWTLRLIFHLVDLAICNGWQEYKKFAQSVGMPKKETMDLLQFRESVTDGLLKANKSRLSVCDSGKPVKRPCYAPTPRPGTSSRYDLTNHFPKIQSDAKNNSRCAYEQCKLKTFIKCSKCKVYLCMNRNNNCFYNYHHK